MTDTSWQQADDHMLAKPAPCIVGRYLAEISLEELGHSISGVYAANMESMS